MTKQKRLIGLIAASVITISISSMMVYGNNKEYDYELNMDNILTTIDKDRTLMLMAEYKEGVSEELISSIEDKVSDLVLEEVEVEEVVQTEETKDKVVENNKDASKDTPVDVVVKNPEQPNNANPIADNSGVKSDLSKHLNNYVLDVIKT